MANVAEHRVQMPAPAAQAGNGMSAAPEKMLNHFVHLVTLIERTGNALGTLAFTWATVVLLGGYPTKLIGKDFWFSTVIVFLEVTNDARALFNDAVRIQVGSGDRVLFWEDPWIQGLTVAFVAPDLLKLVRPSIVRSRTVQQGLPGNAWVRDIAGELTVDAVVQYLQLWTRIQNTTLAEGADVFSWKLSADGQFSTRSAYTACLAGSTALPAARQVWESFAPLKFRFFGWLVLDC
ncbi:hypothetical protein ACQ4PT_014423 [Festuca glaucescens]